jgi:hypothetical protein
MLSNVRFRVARVDYERDAEVLQPLANRYAISLAETEVNHGSREFSLLSHIQRKPPVSTADTTCAQGARALQ